MLYQGLQRHRTSGQHSPVQHSVIGAPTYAAMAEHSLLRKGQPYSTVYPVVYYLDAVMVLQQCMPHNYYYYKEATRSLGA